MRPSSERHDPPTKDRGRPEGARGFTLIEIMIGLTILVVGILGVASMFGTGYTNLAEGGRMTLAVTAARQMLEDIRTIPFNNLPNLNGFDTNNPGTQPANNPEREIARKWRYALAGDGTGWGFTTAEKARWHNLGVGNAVFGAGGTIAVANLGATMREVTITVPVPGRGAIVRLVTRISSGVGQ
jgi:prepilin-type N-terminal cleavage/methylation domain-containing protein